MSLSTGIIHSAVHANLTLAATFALPASVDSWTWTDDLLCNDCQSYRDEDVAAGHIRTAYTPGLGYVDVRDARVTRANRTALVHGVAER